MKHRILLAAAAFALASCSDATHHPVDPVVDPPVPAPVQTTYDFRVVTGSTPLQPATPYRGTLLLTTGGAAAKLAVELKVQACDEGQTCPTRDYRSAAEYTTLDQAGNFESYVYAHDSIGDSEIQLLGRITPDSVSGRFAVVAGRDSPQGDFTARRHPAPALTDRAFSLASR